MTAEAISSVLVIGIGNPAREDDALGPEAANRIAAFGLPDVTVDADYQLTVEDAARIGGHRAVIFVDASTEGPAPYSFSRVGASNYESFSSHSVSPGGVMSLAGELFNAETPAYILAIRGYSFGMFVETLTDGASSNLEQAVSFLMELLLSGTFDEFADNSLEIHNIHSSPQ